jgi:hypothetical protein
MQLALEGLNSMIKAGMNLDAVAGAMNNIVGSLVQIQPPGFAPKTVTATKVSLKKTDFGDRKPPGKAKPVRTADSKTPRVG